MNCGVIFAVRRDFLSDYGEFFKAVIREHRCNRDVGCIASFGDNDAADSRLIVPGVKAIPAIT